MISKQLLRWFYRLRSSLWVIFLTPDNYNVPFWHFLIVLDYPKMGILRYFAIFYKGNRLWAPESIHLKVGMTFLYYLGLHS